MRFTHLVTHDGAHFDEFAAAKLLRDGFGEAKWPGSATAKWEFIDDPNKYKAADLIASGKIPLGVCGGPFDEHPLFDPVTGKPLLTCSTKLLYDRLGIAIHPDISIVDRSAYQELVKYAVWADRGTRVDRHAIPTLIKRRWSAYFRFVGTAADKQAEHKDLIRRSEKDIDELVADSRVFYTALWGLKDTFEVRKLKFGDRTVHWGIIRADNPVADNPKVKDAAMSAQWRQVDEDMPWISMLLKRESKGNVQIFVGRTSRLDLSELVMALRLAELAKRGIVHNLTRDELLREKCELCPWWHYLIGSQTILNGSNLAARGVEATRLDDGELEALINEKVHSSNKVQPQAVPPAPEQIAVDGPLKTLTEDAPGLREELVLLPQGEDGQVFKATFEPED